MLVPVGLSRYHAFNLLVLVWLSRYHPFNILVAVRLRPPILILQGSGMGIATCPTKVYVVCGLHFVRLKRREAIVG